jgi:antitoxin CptB
MNDSPPEDTATRRKRLRFRSWHRGLKETDLLLGNFADRHLEDFGEAELDLYEALLEENDPDVFAWITGSKQPPVAHNTSVLKLIQNFKFTETIT